MKITKRQLKRIIRESLDKMYGEDNLSAWSGAHSRNDNNDDRIADDIGQIAFDAGHAGDEIPEEVSDLQYSRPDVYEQAIEAYEDGYSERT